MADSVIRENSVKTRYFVLALVLSSAAYLWFDAKAQFQVFQLCLTVGIIVGSVILIKFPNSANVRLIMSTMAAFAAIRMMYWRLGFSLNLTSPFNALVSFALLFGEMYAVTCFFLTSVQTLHLNRRVPVVYDPAYQPSVDVFIATYNESVDIVRRTVCGAKSIDYANKQVYLLDDGRRQEMLDLSLSLGVNYITRPDNRHAKAGNINNALPQTNGELVLILDADHITFTTILKTITPFFRDPEVGFVQTAHRFMNPAPIQRNLHIEDKLPHEQQLFFYISMVGKDCWNAAIFAGSAGVIRRSILLELGGMATGTVIEDCEFSLKMHRKNYKSVYLAQAQSIGLCPETLGAYLIQQSRWAKGQTQMLCIGNPLTGGGLTIQQRICYLTNNLYYLFGLPRLVYLVIPILFLLLGVCATSVGWYQYTVMVSAFYVTWLLQQRYTFENFRHSFWSDVYEVILAPFASYWAVATLLDPQAPRFAVTPKGSRIPHYYFDLPLVGVNLILLILSVFAFAIGLIKIILMFDPVGNLVNLIWCAYNIIILASAVLVGLERPQMRKAYRVNRNIAISMTDKNGTVLAGQTQDISEFGAKLQLLAPEQLPNEEERITVTLEADDGELVDITCRVVKRKREREFLVMEVEFKDMNLALTEKLISMVYCSAKTWSMLKEPQVDSLFVSMGNLLLTPARVLVDVKTAVMVDRLAIFIPTWIFQSRFLPKRWKPYVADQEHLAAVTQKNDDPEPAPFL